MDDRPKKVLNEDVPAIDVVPEHGELDEIIRDKRIFGVYKDEDGADRAIRQLNKLGYTADDIYIFTRDRAKVEKMQEEFKEDINLVSCSDGSDFIGSSYDSGDVVICVLKDAEVFGQRGAANQNPSDKPQTTMDVMEQVSKEKQQDD